jgi:anti-sigma regulatory factor (Ser/Thr protein kinase)
MSAFEHDALLYEGTGALVEHVLPFLYGGVERGEGVLVVTSRTNVEALREALGDVTTSVDFRDSASWYSSPGAAFRRYADYVGALEAKRPVRAIGEPVWPVGWKEGVDEWARYESVLNVAFADAPAWIVCPYDVSALPDPILEHAHHTHPTLYDRGRRTAHAEYEEPGDFWSRLDRAAPFAQAIRARRFPVTPDLAALREQVASEAAAAGVPLARLSGFLAAVHEVAINALTHGGGAAAARTWIAGDTFVCEVADVGPGLAEPYAGYRLPDAHETRGRGLWLARQFCDLVELRSSAEGTAVRVHVRRGG